MGGYTIIWRDGISNGGAHGPPPSLSISHVHTYTYTYTYTCTRTRTHVALSRSAAACTSASACFAWARARHTHTHTLTHSLTALAHVTHTDHTHTVLLICKVRGLLRAQLAVCNVEVQCASRLDTVPARHCCVCGYCCGRPTVPRQRNPHTGMGGRRVFSAPEGGFFRCGACALVLPPSSMRVPPGCHVD